MINFGRDEACWTKTTSFAFNRRVFCDLCLFQPLEEDLTPGNEVFVSQFLQFRGQSRTLSRCTFACPRSRSSENRRPNFVLVFGLDERWRKWGNSEFQGQADGKANGKNMHWILDSQQRDNDVPGLLRRSQKNQTNKREKKALTGGQSNHSLHTSSQVDDAARFTCNFD